MEIRIASPPESWHARLLKFRRINFVFVQTTRGWTSSLFPGPFAEEFGDVEIDKVGVMKNDRLDRALDFVAFMAVGGDDVQDLAGQTMLVRECDAAERMPHLLAERALDHIARSVLIILEWLADICQQRSRDEEIALDRNAAAERALQHISDGDALQSTGVEMLDERHVDVAGQQRKFNRPQFVQRPALPATAGRDRLIPNRSDFFPERFIFDLHQAGKKLRDFLRSIFGWLNHHGDVDLNYAAKTGKSSTALKPRNVPPKSQLSAAFIS